MILSMLLVLHSTAYTQLQKDKEYHNGLTDLQLAAIKTLGKEMDDKITLAFKSNPKLKKDMEEDLRKIEAIKDKKLQLHKAAQYQDKYMEGYTDVLKSGKVDLVLYARQMEAIIPWYKFTLNSRNIIVGQMKTINGNITSIPLGPVSKRITEFKQIFEKSCFVASSGGVTFSGNSIEANTVAAVAGGCGLSAEMSSNPDSEEGYSKVNVKSKLNTSGFVIAVVGFSISLAIVYCIFPPRMEDYKDLGGFLIFAPLLWVGSVDQDFTQDDTFGYRSGKKISFKISLSSGGMIVSASHSEAKLTNIDVKLLAQ